MEVCRVVPGQIYKKKVPSNLTKDVVDFATKKPQDRLSAITSAPQHGATGMTAPVSFIYRMREIDMHMLYVGFIGIRICDIAIYERRWNGGFLEADYNQRAYSANTTVVVCR